MGVDDRASTSTVDVDLDVSLHGHLPIPDALRAVDGVIFDDVVLDVGDEGALHGAVALGRFTVPQIEGTVRIDVGTDGQSIGGASWTAIVGGSVPLALVSWSSAMWSPADDVPIPAARQHPLGVHIDLPDPVGGFYEVVPLAAEVEIPGQDHLTVDTETTMILRPPTGARSDAADAASIVSLVDESGLADALAAVSELAADEARALIERVNELTGASTDVAPASAPQSAGTAEPTRTDGAAEVDVEANAETDEPLSADGEAAAITDTVGDPELGATDASAADTVVELLIPPAPSEPSPAQRSRAATVGSRVSAAGRSTTDLPSAADTTAEARGGDRAGRGSHRPRRGRSDRGVGRASCAQPGDRRTRRPHPAVDPRSSTGRRRRVARHGSGRGGRCRRPRSRCVGPGRCRSGDRRLRPDERGAADRRPGGGNADEPATCGRRTRRPRRSECRSDAIPADDLSLANDQQRVADDVAASGIETPTTQGIPSHPFSTVREGQDELGEMEADRTAEVAAAQQAAIDTSRVDMAALQAQAVEALRTSRADTVGTLGAGQDSMVGSEEMTRSEVSQRASSIFTTAQTQVAGLLEPLSRNAMARWDAGVTRLSTVFRTDLDRVKDWIEDRHSGIGGALVAIGDAVFGLPGWVVEEYDRAERAFGDGVHDLLLEISTEVNGIIAAAEAIIQTARDQITELFESLPADLQEWANGELARFDEQLDGLAADVHAAQADINSGISERAVTAVAEVQHEVEQLRVEAGGVVGRIAAAIAEFVDDPVRFIINGLLQIVGIPPGSFWALIARIQHVVSDIADDPMRFLDLLLQGLGLGFEKFLDHFPAHLVDGFFAWLFRGLGDVGVEIPPDFSLPSLVKLALQIMGITWQRFRQVLEDHLGPEAVEVLETVWNIVDAFVRDGIQGIYDLFLPQFNPQELVDTILDAAISYVTEVLVVQVGAWIVSLLSPAGWVAKAVEIIYKVAKWVFENAAPMFEFVETVVNGVARLLTGDVSGMAAAVEMGLAATIPITIDFFAGLIGLGDLPEKVVEVIGRLQQIVYDIMDRVVGWLVEHGHALLARLGLVDEDVDQDDAGGGGGDTELGDDVPFTGGGERHRLWIDTRGTDARLMMASAPRQVIDRLPELRADVDRKFENDDEKRSRGRTLVDEATTLAESTDMTADELVAAFAQAAQDDAVDPPDDAAVEAAERTLAGVLRELFDLLGIEGDDLELELLKVEIAAALPGRVADLGQRAHQWWQQSIERVTFGMTADEQPQQLWPTLRPNPLSPAQFSGATAEAGDTANYDDYLFDYFTDEDGRRNQKAADTNVFSNHAFSSTANPGKVRREVIAKLVTDAAARLRADYEAEIQATDKDDAFKSAARQKLAKFDAPPDLEGYYGRLPLPVDRVPDHSWFAPKEKPTSNPDVRVEADKRVTTYETKAGNQFRIEETNLTRGARIRSEGTNLSFHSLGRGVTQDSPGIITNRNLNRAHIIANEIGGSGYSAARNLVTTSAYYNQRPMRASEEDLKHRVEDSLDPRGPLALGDVTFNLAVTVELADLEPEPIADAILRHPELRDHLVQYANLVSVLTRQDVADAPFMRVIQIIYDLVIAGSRATPDISKPGIDLWIVFDV